MELQPTCFGEAYVKHIFVFQTSSCTTAAKVIGPSNAATSASSPNVSSPSSTPSLVKSDPKPVECNLCHRKFKNVPALNGHMRLHGGYFKKVGRPYSNATYLKTIYPLVHVYFRDCHCRKTCWASFTLLLILEHYFGHVLILLNFHLFEPLGT